MAEINEIVSREAIESVLKAAKGMTDLDNAMIKFLQDQEKYKKQAEDVNETVTDNATKTNKYTKILNKAAEDQNKLTATARALAAQQKQLTDTEAKLIAVNTKSNQKLTEQKLKLQEAQKAMIAKTKANQAEEGSLVKMRQKLSELTAAYDASGKRTKAAAQEIASLSKEIELAENETNRFQRGVGGYANQMKALIPGLMNGSVSIKQFGAAAAGAGKAMMAFLLSPVGLIVSAVAGIIMLGKTLINNAREFEAAADSLQAITDANEQQMSMMKQSARDLSRISVSSATDIIKAYERVGSALPELLDNSELLTKVTADAIILSEATQGKLSVEDAARAAAAAMNQFNIPLDESTRAVNVLAAGSLAGSAEVDSLAESFKNVGAVASGAGMSLEQTTAALEILGEKSLYGTEAGTKLRGVILKLQDAGIGYASGTFNLKDALEEANQKIDQQATALEKDAYAQKLFGLENITAGKIMLSSIEKYEKLTNAVTGTNTAYQQAAIQNDNLNGSYKKLGNAWSSMLLSVEDGNGFFSKVWKGIIDGLIQDINNLTFFIDLFKSKAARERKAEKMAAKEKQKEDEVAAKLAEERAIEQAKLAEERAIEQAKLDQEKEIADKAAADEKAAKNKEILEKQKAAAKEKAAYEKKLADEQFKIAAAAAQREYDMQLMLIQATSKTKEEAENRTFEFKKQSLLKTLDLQQLELDSFKGNELEKLAIQERINKTRYDLEKLGMEERIKLNEEGIKKMEPIKKKELGLEKGKLQEVAAASTEHAEQEIIRQEQTAEQKKQIIEASTEGVIQIQGALFDFMDAKYQGDLQRLEQKNAAGLISDQEYAKQKAEIEIKQAKASRLRAIFEATIGTAQAVISALQTKPFLPLGLIMAATAGVVGGLQIASILSQPLPTMPAFAEGTDSAPDHGLFGEKGRELMRTTGGEMIMANEPTIFAGNKFKGAKIWNNDETEYIMNRTREPQFGQPTRTDDRILRGLNSVEKAIKDKPVFIFDKEKNVVGMVRGSHTERYINRLKLNS